MSAASRAVIFDLDGTLTPRRASVERMAGLFAEDFADALERIEVGVLATTLVACDHGGYNPRRALDLIETLPWRTPPSPAELEGYWQRRFPDAVVPQPGLHAVLGTLRERGFRLGVVTNGGVSTQRRKLECLGVHAHMDAVVISEGVGCRKPDPRIFEMAADGLGARHGDCWFVGDHPENDVLGAERCGMRGVWITDPRATFPWPEGEPPAAHHIERLDELLPLVGDA